MGKHKGKGKLIYFSDDEWEVVEKKAEDTKLNTTNYIKRMAIKGYIIEYNLDKINELIYEINKIGVNINQLTRKTNEINNIYSEDMKELQKQMAALWSLLKSNLLKLN